MLGRNVIPTFFNIYPHELTCECKSSVDLGDGVINSEAVVNKRLFVDDQVVIQKPEENLNWHKLHVIERALFWCLI